MLANSHAVGVVVQHILEILHRVFVHDEHRLAFRLFTLLLVGELALLNLDVVFVGQPAQCLGIGHLLVLHDERDGISALAASKTMTGVSGWRHHERRGFLVVERTQALIVCATLLERHKLRHYLYDIGGVLDSLYGLSVNHCL